MGPETEAADRLHGMKYRSPGEDFRESMNRVAFGLKDSDQHYHQFREIILDQRFLPGGRIQSAIGSSKHVTSHNCYVSGTIADSYVEGPGSIMHRAHEAAATMRMGGGIGYDFSTLRPRGELVAKLQSQSSGPVSFMHIFDAVCLATASSGHRRGAQMGVLRCLAGDSLIHTLDGLVPIKDLVGTNPYVYACDPKKRKVHIVQADKVFVSDKDRELIRVMFDTKTYLDCTTDHLVMLSSGDYVHAGHLRRGDSIMAIEHGISQHGNADRFVRTVGCTYGRADYEHRVIARDVLGAIVDSNWHVHHQDEDSCNNDPANLAMVNRSEHAKLHSSNLAVHRERIAAERKGKTRAELYGEEKAAEWESKRQETRRLRLIQNHRVISVTPLETVEDVYDISLPEWHNFAVNGVFVHNCDHPDIEEFIHAKNNRDKLVGFNISVAVTDEFMEAVASGSEFALRWGGKNYRYVDAQELWENLMRSTWDWAEPGVVFIDTINRMNNLYYCETIASTNPCSEQPLPPFGACLLGSWNLVKYLGKRPVAAGQNPWYFNFDQLKYDVAPVVRALDNVIDKTRYPLAEQRAEAITKRRMGIGITGLANAGEVQGYVYGSDDFCTFESDVLETISEAAYMASADLAAEKGPFPLFDAERYLAGNHVKTLPDEVQHAIKIKGIRNSHLTSIAPTGTISLCADNVSSSIEPVFAYHQERPINTPTGAMIDVLEDYGVKFLNIKGKLAADVTAQEHVKVLLTAQKHLDSAASKTVNMDGRKMPWADFKAIYQTVWENGGKGCATYNVAGRRGSLLRDAESDEPALSEGDSCEIDLLTGRRNCE